MIILSRFLNFLSLYFYKFSLSRSSTNSLLCVCVCVCGGFFSICRLISYFSSMNFCWCFLNILVTLIYQDSMNVLLLSLILSQSPPTGSEWTTHAMNYCDAVFKDCRCTEKECCEIGLAPCPCLLHQLPKTLFPPPHFLTPHHSNCNRTIDTIITAMEKRKVKLVTNISHFRSLA